MDRRRVPLLLFDLAIAALLFYAAGRVYRESTGRFQSCDSVYSLVASEKLIAAGTCDLSGNVPAGELPYQLVRHVDPRRPDAAPAVYYGYPLGSTLLSLPLVRHYAVSRGLTAFRPDGTPNLEAEAQVQLRVAGRVSAAIAVLSYAIARFFCPPILAAAIALGFAFGSPIWSTLSRALWSHTWMVFWLAAAVLLLLVERRVARCGGKGIAVLGAGLGTAAFWMAFTRPQAVLSAAAIGLYLAFQSRRLLAATVAVGAAWLAVAVGASLHELGVSFPPSVYRASAIDGREPFERLGWLLLSPSRGLLVFCPYLAVVAWLLASHRRTVPDARLLLPAGAAVGAYAALFASYNGWHAGSSYGPRYFCDVLPWFVLATAMGLAALRAADVSRRRKAVEIAALVAGFAWGGFVHCWGANENEAWDWNFLAQTATEEGAAKDWRHPQFLSGITFRVRPDGTPEELK